MIGLQLDNEIGMLAWVTNSPELGRRSMTLMAEKVMPRVNAAIAAGR